MTRTEKKGKAQKGRERRRSTVPKFFQKFFEALCSYVAFGGCARHWASN